jgi:hypothetical protein
LKREALDVAKALSQSGHAAHVQELADGLYVVVTGPACDCAYEVHDARRFALGEASQPVTSTAPAVIYHVRTGRLLGDGEGKAVLSPEQIDVLDALLRWG